MARTPRTAPADSADRVRTPRRRVGLDPAVVTRAAVELVDAEGLDALTMTRLARRLDVTQPALYAHVENLAAVQRAVGLFGMRALSEELRAAVLGRSGDDALRALAEAYRGYVRRHPDRFVLQFRAPVSPEYREAGERAAEAVRAVLRSYGLNDDEVRLAHGFFRSSVHGFAMLEMHARAGRTVDAAGGGAPPHMPDDGPDDAAFEYFLENFADMLRRRAGSAG